MCLSPASDSGPQPLPHTPDPTRVPDPIVPLTRAGPCLTAKEMLGRDQDCLLPVEEAGVLWDSVCFLFLLLQRRVFLSYYFLHVKAELQATALQASRLAPPWIPWAPLGQGTVPGCHTSRRAMTRVISTPQGLSAHCPQHVVTAVAFCGLAFQSYYCPTPA